MSLEISEDIIDLYPLSQKIAKLHANLHNKFEHKVFQKVKTLLQALFKLEQRIVDSFIAHAEETALGNDKLYRIEEDIHLYSDLFLASYHTIYDISPLNLDKNHFIIKFLSYRNYTIHQERLPIEDSYTLYETKGYMMGMWWIYEIERVGYNNYKVSETSTIRLNYLFRQAALSLLEALNDFSDTEE